MKPLFLLLAALLLPGCATIGELIEGDFDNRDEYQQAVIEELNQHSLPESIKGELQRELFLLFDQYSNIVADHDSLREALKARIIRLLLGA